MDFVWNDGGRSASGFVGMTGDCVTRSIAIATGTAYRVVYDSLGLASEKSPRNGIQTTFAEQYLADQHWVRVDGQDSSFFPVLLPKGVVIVHLVSESQRSQHFCTLIDQVVHDTWNPTEEERYRVRSYWICKSAQSEDRLLSVAPLQPKSNEQLVTQAAFDKILSRLRALDRTASNGASTEGEKHNAIRMMQDLMLRHNLSRDDIVDNDNVEHVLFTRMACPLNGRRSCAWELNLAAFVALHVFPSTLWYYATRAHRTLVWFYGPKSDVENAISLYQELLLTIASAARLQFGGHSRGSGASYAEGYVQGLPRSSANTSTASSSRSDPSKPDANQNALIVQRTLALQSAATKWLNLECNTRLTTCTSAGRSQHDATAQQKGRLHGSQHEIAAPKLQARIGHRDLKT